jgi:HlyD family secretion protein
MGMKRWAMVMTVAAIVSAAVIYGFMPRPVPVDIARAERAGLRVTVDEEGVTMVKERFVVSAPVAGHLLRPGLDPGDPVKKGRVVAEIEPLKPFLLDARGGAEARASVASARAALKAAGEDYRAAEATDAHARAGLERARSLYDAGYATKAALDEAEASARRGAAGLLAARAAVDAAQSNLEGAEAALKYQPGDGIEAKARPVEVRSPADGLVLRLHRESEGAINAGEPILEVGNPGVIEVRAEVLSADAVRIRPGMTVDFERWGGEAPLTGTVRVVEPSGFTRVSSLGIEEQRVVVLADIAPGEAVNAGLGDGFRVEASFVVWEGRDVVQVPASALFRKGDGWAVFVVEGKRARLREIVAGRRNGLKAEVVSGLAEGDAVIAGPDDAIKDGVAVRERPR